MRDLIALVCAATVGCTAPTRHLTLGLPRREVAEVRGLDESSGSFGLPPPECHVGFEAIDGESLEDRFEDGLPRVIDLRPGDHVLRCRYQVLTVGGQTKDGTSDVPIRAQAGHIYQLRMNWGFNTVATGDTFTLELRDITGELRRPREEEGAWKREAGGRLDPY